MALIEIAPTTTMEEVLQAYPSAKVALFQSYHIGGCEGCGYQPAQTLDEVRRSFNIRDGVDEMASVIRGSAEVFASLHMSAKNLAAGLRADDGLTLLDARTREEHDAGNLPGSRLVTVELTFEILDTWSKDTLLVFFSGDGKRSLDKASYFRAYGFARARSLAGGLAVWAAREGAAGGNVDGVAASAASDIDRVSAIGN